MSSAGRPPVTLANHDVVVVIPAFNEQGAIRRVVSEVLEHGHRVVVVDDGSSEPLLGQLSGLPVHALRHPINLGQGAALQTGIEYALRMGARVIVTFDADGQHRAADIARLLEPLAEGRAQVALGSRFLAGGAAVNIGTARYLLLKAATLFTRITTGLALTDTHNGLRAFDARAAAAIRITQSGMAHASQILQEIASKRLAYVEVPVTLLYTEYSLKKGQRASNAFNILWDSFIGFFHR